MSIDEFKAESSSNQLLQAQVDALEKITDLQRSQIRTLEQLKISMAGSTRTSVKIEDFNMPFMNLVGLLVKIALASIPAAIILAIVYAILAFLLTAVFGGIGLLSMF